MNILINLFVITGIYIFLGILLLTPFILSARISHWEEANRK